MTGNKLLEEEEGGESNNKQRKRRNTEGTTIAATIKKETKKRAIINTFVSLLRREPALAYVQFQLRSFEQPSPAQCPCTPWAFHRALPRPFGIQHRRCPSHGRPKKIFASLHLSREYKRGYSRQQREGVKKKMRTSWTNATSAMTATFKTFGITETSHDIALYTHRARNYAQLGLSCPKENEENVNKR